MQSKHARVCLQRKGSHAARAECAQNFQRVVFLRARAEESAAKQARAAALLLVKLVQNVQLKAPKEKKTVKKKKRRCGPLRHSQVRQGASCSLAREGAWTRLKLRT